MRWTALFPSCSVLLLMVIMPGIQSPVVGDEPVEQQIQEATEKLVEGTTYRLQYRLEPGEQLRYRVEHVAEVATTIQGTRQKTRSESLSTKVWKVAEAPKPDRIQFSYHVEDARMWSEVSGRQRVSYDSQTDEQPPPEYADVAETLGKPLAMITMDRHGRIIEREDRIQKVDLGFGSVTVPLPDRPVPVGFRWTAPMEIRVRTSDQQFKTIKIQHRYRLEKVETGVATISIESQVLTPVRDPKVESQLVQRMSKGVIRFDVDAGRMLSKQLDWDETVVAFNGADSHMEYAARFVEQLVDSKTSVASRDKGRADIE